MKNIIFKSLVIGAMVFGVTIVANAQDSSKSVYELREIKRVKPVDLSKVKKVHSDKVSQKPNRVVSKKKAVKNAAYYRLEKAPIKKTVK